MASNSPSYARAALGIALITGVGIVASGVAFGGGKPAKQPPNVSSAQPALAPTPLPPPPAAPAAPEPCPPEMALVSGEYCTDVRQDCLRWLDDETLPFARCAEYSTKSRCVGKRVQMRFCMDRREYTRPGEELPQNYASFEVASQTCKSVGKRICTDNEWNFACEGEEMRPYPYGYERKPVCNQDRSDLFEKNPRMQVLRDLREPGGARPDCVSPFGIENMAGNMDEPTLREGFENNLPFRNALKGGWWMPARNRCRPATTAHDDFYKDIQIGVRCCDEAQGGAPPRPKSALPEPAPKPAPSAAAPAGVPGDAPRVEASPSSEQLVPGASSLVPNPVASSLEPPPPASAFSPGPEATESMTPSAPGGGQGTFPSEPTGAH